MELRWTGANVVITARVHNPSILSPAWINQQGIIDEPSENFVHTPIFTLYQSQSFQLVVEQERLTLAARVLSEANLERLQRAVTRYVDTLPHVPYTGLGLNFTWDAVASGPDEVRAFAEAALPERLSHAFPEGEVRPGAFLYNLREGVRLRVLVQPKVDEQGFGIDFNYHFDVRSPEAANAAVCRLSECFSGGQQIAQRLFRVEET